MIELLASDQSSSVMARIKVSCRALLGTAIGYLLTLGVCLAQLDDATLKYAQSHHSVIYWDNFEGAPYHISGPLPGANDSQGIAWLSLKDRPLVLQLPAGRQLRIELKDAELVHKLQLWASNGSLIGQELKLSAGDVEGRFYLPAEPASRLIIIEQVEKESVPLALFLSRLEQQSPAALYREQLALDNAEQVPLYLGVDRHAQPYYRLLPERVVELKINGPQRLQLEHRLYLADEQLDGRQSYQIDYAIDGVAGMPLLAKSSLNSVTPGYVNHRLAVLGYPRQHYLDIPEGEHKVSLRSSSELLLRVLGDSDESLLLPKWNQPALWEHERELPPWPTLTVENYPEIERWVEKQLADERHVRVVDELLSHIERSPLPVYQALVKRLLQEHFSYGDLPPFQALPGGVTFRSFVPVTLAPLDGEQWSWRYPKRQSIAEFAAISRGRFFALSESESHLDFLLPKQRQQHRLRLAVDAESITEPMMLELRSHGELLQRFKIDPRWQVWQKHYGYESTLAAMKQQGLFSHTMTMGGRYGLYQQASRYTRVASAEFMLPAGQYETELRVSDVQNRDERALPPLAVNLQQLNSRADTLTPFHSMRLLQHLDAEQRSQLFWQLLQGETVEMDETQQRLAKQWAGVIRHLRDSNQGYLYRLDRSPLPEIIPMAPGRVDEYQRQALEAQRRGDYLAALEAWNRLQNGSYDVALQIAALRGKAVALVALSEHTLAERELMRYALLHQNPELRRAARQQLLGYYSLWDDQADYHALLIASALHEQSDTLLFDVIEQWALEAKMADFFTVALIFAPNPRLNHFLVAASYQLQCWRCFDELLGELNDQQLIAYWRGYKAMWWGDLRETEAQWEMAGEYAEALLTHFKRGEISELFDEHAPIEAERLLQWPHYYQALPGPRRWQEAGRLAVTANAGAVRVHDQVRDRYSFAYLAESDKPVTLSVLGPRKLRLNVRLLHPSNNPDMELDGWLYLKNNQSVWRRPLLASRPSTSLAIEGPSLGYPGIAHTLEFDLTEGINEIELKVPGHAALFDMQMDAPQRPLANYPDPQLAFHLVNNIDILRRGRVIPERGSWMIPEPWDRHESGYLETPEQQLSSLLWWSEHEPDHYREYMSRAWQLRQQYADRPQVRTVANRIMRGGEWQLQQNVLQSAGKRLLTQQGWSPDSAGLRLKNALLAPLSSHEFRLLGPNVWGVSHYIAEGQRWQLALDLEDLNALKHPLRVMVQLDQQPPKAITLTPERARHLESLSMPSGVHQLRVWIDQSVAGQLLRVGLFQMDEEGVTTPWPLETQRSYFVATQNEPLQLRIKGPQLLQILERVGNREQYYYVPLDEGWNQPSLAPRFSAQEALLRVFELALDEAWQPPQTAYLPREVEIPSRLEVPRETISLAPLYEDAPFDPGSHEDGTLSYHGDWVQRHLPEDVANQEKFLQIGAQYRKFNAYQQLYQRLSADMRIREYGNPSFAFEGTLEWLPWWTAWRGQLQGKSFWQKPDSQHGKFEWGSQVNASFYQLHRLGPKSYHIPKLTLFYRAMSLDFNPYRRGWLDQDVFTQHKHQHRTGWQLADSYTYQPWVDTAWTFKGWLNSNDALGDSLLDAVGASAMWRQIIGEGEYNLSIAQRYYLADDERDSSLSSTTLALQAKWGGWSSSWNRWQIQGRLSYRLQEGQFGFMLGVTWHNTQGRNYRDFLPGEEFFKPVRQWHLPSHSNKRAAQ